jgi:Ca2+/Na+ antiporter
MGIGEFVRDNAAVLLLAGAAAGWYAASFCATDALAGGKLALRRRVFAQWLPILTLALVATLAQQTSVALGVLLASSVAALSLVLGIVTISHEFGRRPTDAGGFPVVETHGAVVVERRHGAVPAESSPSVARRVWAFVLPAAMILLLAGFTGRLNGAHALLLAVEGLAILTLWNARGEFDEIDASAPAPAAAARGTLRRAAEFTLAILLALLASWAGVRATLDVSRQIGQVSGGFVAALLVAPALVLPMIGSGMMLSRANLYSGAVSASVGIVLLNLCFGLPLVVGVWYAKPLWGGRAERLVAMVTPANGDPTTAPTTSAPDLGALAPDPSIRFPISLWRVDTVLLILLGLVLLPLAAGRWLPGKFEGVMLVCVYIIYMGLTTWAARA